MTLAYHCNSSKALILRDNRANDYSCRNVIARVLFTSVAIIVGEPRAGMFYASDWF